METDHRAPNGEGSLHRQSSTAPKARAMGSHQSAGMKSDTWLTPPEIIRALGTFTLDPCCPEGMPWKTATKCFTPADDGLKQKWRGRVWLNPPYSREAVLWLRKLAEHGNGIALTFARTETEWFFETIWNKATALLFLQGRIHFHHQDGRRAKANAGAPSVLAAYGFRNAGDLEAAAWKYIPGKFIWLARSQYLRHKPRGEEPASGLAGRLPTQPDSSV